MLVEAKPVVVTDEDTPVGLVCSLGTITPSPSGGSSEDSGETGG